MGAQSLIEIPKISVEEYLKKEFESLDKNEYYDGYVVAMAGGSPAHSLIPGSLVYLIQNHIRQSKSSCFTYSSDQRVRIEETNSYVYPDLTIVCNQPVYNQDNPQALLNPTLIIEILSSSTKDWDTTYKKKLYKQIPSLQEILYVDSVKPYIGGLYRSGENWLDGFGINRPEETYRLQTLGLDLNLAEVYGSVLESFGPIDINTHRRES